MYLYLGRRRINLSGLSVFSYKTLKMFKYKTYLNLTINFVSYSHKILANQFIMYICFTRTQTHIQILKGL